LRNGTEYFTRKAHSLEREGRVKHCHYLTAIHFTHLPADTKKQLAIQKKHPRFFISAANRQIEISPYRPQTLVFTEQIYLAFDVNLPLRMDAGC
jgi:hypothetical protein